jgi:hypothetical protein
LTSYFVSRRAINKTFLDNVAALKKYNTKQERGIPTTLSIKMNTVSDHLSNQFVDAHNNQKLFLPDASLSFNFKQNEKQQYNMSNLVNTMPQFCMVMDSPQYANANPTTIHQNMGYSDSVPIIDLSQKTDEPFVLCKLPINMYNRVVEMLQTKENMEASSPTHTPNVSTPIHANTSTQSPIHLSSTPYMTPQQMHTPLPTKQHLQLHMTPVNGMSTPPTPNVSTPLKTGPNALSMKDDEYHIKGSWTEEEDKKLVDLVKKYGAKRWSFIASHLKGRIGKQCRERYLNHLDPKINKKAWTNHEDSVIVEMHSKHGNQWAKISRMLPGRTANAIKNHWNSTLSRRLEKLKRSPGDSNGEEDSLDENDSGDESFDGNDSLHHVMINPPPLPQGGPYSGTSSSSTTRVLGGFNAIGGPISTTANNGQMMDMPKFELFPTGQTPNFNAKKRLRLDEESEEMHYDHDHEDDMQHDLDEHQMEELAEDQDEHQHKRFKPHVLDLTQSHSISEQNKMKDSDNQLFNPFPQAPTSTRPPLKSPSESGDAATGQKYKNLTLNLDDGANHDFDFSVICHNNYDCGLNLAEDSGPQGSQRRPSIQGNSATNSTTPSNLSLTPSNHMQEFFSDSLFLSPNNVKNAGVKNKNFVTCT